MLIHFDASGLRQTRWYEYAVRFLFGGIVTVAAGIIAQRFGPTVGGLFLAFPAIFPASASLIEKHAREKKERVGVAGRRAARKVAAVDAAGAALGTFGLAAFALIAWKYIASSSLWLVLIAATVVWAATALAAWLARKRGVRILRARRSEWKRG